MIKADYDRTEPYLIILNESTFFDKKFRTRKKRGKSNHSFHSFYWFLNVDVWYKVTQQDPDETNKKITAT